MNNSQLSVMAAAMPLRQGSVAGSLKDVGDQAGEAAPFLIGAAPQALPEHPGHRYRDPLRSALEQIHARSRS